MQFRLPDDFSSGPDLSIIIQIMRDQKRDPVVFFTISRWQIIANHLYKCEAISAFSTVVHTLAIC